MFDKYIKDPQRLYVMNINIFLILRHSPKKELFNSINDRY